MEAHITLYGDSAREFWELQEELEQEFGIESNAGTVRWLLAQTARPDGI